MAIDHEVGQFPLSIGTSLAIEGLLGIHPGKPNQPAGHKGIAVLWVNLRTLVRNYYQSMKATDTQRIKYPEAALVLLSEVQAIPEILRQHRRSIAVVFYHQPNEDIKRQFPNAAYKQPKTDKQTHYQVYEDYTLRFLLEECKNAHVEIHSIRKQPPNSRHIGALLSHYPKDLFWKNCFERLFLLESHTGRLKTYIDWYTKLQGVKADKPLPLNEFTIQVFGDGNLFDGQDKKLKDELRQLAAVRRWNGATAMNKVSADILGYGSAYLKEAYRRLLP